MQKWIKCSERMPELSQQVLCIDSCGEYEVAYYDKGYRSGRAFFFTCTGIFDATHWQPLPEPPQD